MSEGNEIVVDLTPWQWSLLLMVLSDATVNEYLTEEMKEELGKILKYLYKISPYID